MISDSQQETTTLMTSGGFEISISQHCHTLDISQQDSPLDSIYAQIDTHKGAILSSGFDYPGRHSRWDIGFINPALEFTSKGRTFSLVALNEQGEGLLSLIRPTIENCPHVESISQDSPSQCSNYGSINGVVLPSSKQVREEERSKQPSVFSILRAIGNLFYAKNAACSLFGFYGAFGYDLIHQFENIDLKMTRSTDSNDCHLFFPLDVIAVDRKREVAIYANCNIPTPLGNTNDLASGGVQHLPSNDNICSQENQIQSDHKLGEFADKVRQVVEGTKRGDYFEVVLSQTFKTPFNGTPTVLFKRLAKINPSPYMFLINLGQEQLVGASPEIYARITDRVYETCPIAGTIPRGASALEDADQVMQLIGSNKDESELTMCTDVDRNDMARVCVPGSVKIIGRRQLEFYSHLIHTVDHLQGTLAPEYDALDAFQSHMWACTVTGAPKPAAVQEIENLEASPREWYSGAIGLFAINGDINSGITLRTAHLKNGLASIRAGATLLYESDPEMEEKETRTKAAAFLTALAKDYNADKSKDERQLQTAKLKSQIPSKRVVLVDHRDSFVHNLASYLRELGASVVTLRSGFDFALLGEIKPDLVLLSPGPGTPAMFGINALIEKLIAEKYPIFGVCLGHQGIGEYFGATLSQLPIPVHGKRTLVKHNNNRLFANVPEVFEVGRYHSLYLTEESIPNELEITSRSIQDDRSTDPHQIVMSIRHKNLPIAGVQFHPESLMTLKQVIGHQLLFNILKELT